MTEPTAVQALTTDLVVDAVNDVLSGKRSHFERVGPDTVLHELGLNSLEVTELFAMLEDRSGLELDPESAEYLRTVGDLTQIRVVGG